MNQNSKILLALLAGAAAGAALGILFAPDKGSETRKKIGEKLDDLMDEAGETVGSLKEQIKAGMDNVMQSVNDLKEEADNIKS